MEDHCPFFILLEIYFSFIINHSLLLGDFMSHSDFSFPSLSLDLLQGQMKDLGCLKCSHMEIFHFRCQKRKIQDLWMAKVNRLPTYDCKFLQARATALKHTVALIQDRRSSYRLFQGAMLFTLSLVALSIGGGIYLSLNDRKPTFY